MDDEKIAEDLLNRAVSGFRLNDDSRKRIITDLQAKKHSKVSNRKKGPSLIAVFLIVGLAGGAAVDAENFEYNKAVEFFDEYKLSAEGLSRGEIKNVYKDITTGRFIYDKTTEVIIRSVGGKEIFQDEPSNEDLEDLWNYRNNNSIFVPDFDRPDPDDVSFEYSFIEGLRSDSAMEPGVYWDTVFKKMKHGSEIWSIRLRDFNYSGHVRAGDFTILFGTNTMIDSNTRSFTRVVMIGDDGKEKWVFSSPGKFEHEYYFEALFESGDNSVMLFGVGDYDILMCTKLDVSSGSLISHEESRQSERMYVDTAAKFGDGFLILAKNYQQSDRIIKTDLTGKPVDSFVYDAENEFYTIRDMAELGGKVYVSGYAVPKTDIDDGYGGRQEIADILKYIFEEKDMEIENAELTRMLRENYTAVLLVCDTGTGVPQEFYSVRGSLGADLTITEADRKYPEGLLEWDVESPT